MSAYPKITVRDYRAEVLSEEKYACLTHSQGAVPTTKLDAPARITRSWLRAAKARALAAGHDRVEVTTSRYVRYMLYGALVMRSGAYVVHVRYQHRADGTWVKTTEIENRVY